MYCEYLCLVSDKADFNECDSNPCQHGGTCVDLYDGYECICAECPCLQEVAGTHCERMYSLPTLSMNYNSTNTPHL